MYKLVSKMRDEKAKIHAFPRIPAKKKLKFSILVNYGPKNAKMYCPDIRKTCENAQKH